MLNSFHSSILCNWKVRTSGNSWYFQDGGTFVSKLPAYQNPVRFHSTLFKLPNPGANIYVQRLLKFPTWGEQGRSKSPPHPVVPPPPPPLGHNIDSCIIFMRLKTQKGYISRENIICSRKNPCRMYFSGQMSVYLLMKECEHWRAFDHKIYFVGYDYIGNRKKYY